MTHAPTTRRERQGNCTPIAAKLSNPADNFIAYWRARRQGRPGYPLTQAQLASLVARSVTIVGRYERGLRLPSVRTLFAIAAALEVPPHVLYPGLWRLAREGADKRRDEQRLGPALY